MYGIRLLMTVYDGPDPTTATASEGARSTAVLERPLTDPERVDAGARLDALRLHDHRRHEIRGDRPCDLPLPSPPPLGQQNGG
jgi:hypothetical protein